MEAHPLTETYNPITTFQCLFPGEPPTLPSKRGMAEWESSLPRSQWWRYSILKNGKLIILIAWSTFICLSVCLSQANLGKPWHIKLPESASICLIICASICRRMAAFAGECRHLLLEAIGISLSMPEYNRDKLIWSFVPVSVVGEWGHLPYCTLWPKLLVLACLLRIPLR